MQPVHYTTDCDNSKVRAQCLFFQSVFISSAFDISPSALRVLPPPALGPVATDERVVDISVGVKLAASLSALAFLNFKGGLVVALNLVTVYEISDVASKRLYMFAVPRNK